MGDERALSGYWKMDDGSGMVLRDSKAGNPRPATIHRAAWTVVNDLPVGPEYGLSGYLEKFSAAAHITDYQLQSMSVSTIDDVSEVIRAMGLPPEYSNTNLITAVVMVGTVITVGATIATSLVAAPATGGLSILGGLVISKAALGTALGLTAAAGTVGANAFWLSYPTGNTDALQWDAIRRLYNTVATMLRGDVVDKLDDAKNTFDDRINAIRGALEDMDAGRATAKQIELGHDSLTDIHDDLCKVRSQLNKSTEKQSILTQLTPRDITAIMQMSLPYIYLHSYVLIAMVLLSEEFNNAPPKTREIGK